MNGRIDDFISYYKNSKEVLDVDPNIWMANYIVDRMELNEEQILWFCFLCSITYQLPTAYMIINEYPDLELVGEERLIHWWNEVQQKCPFQTDKLKQRKFFPETVISYKKLVGDSQKDFFDSLLNSTPQENFNKLWDSLYKNIKHFGRFSVWNWAQMLKQVAGYKIEPEKMFLGESNAESHTHGICLALGKDDWAKKERVTYGEKRIKIVHSFTSEEKSYLEEETNKIITEIEKEGIEVDKFLIETIACAYKKTFRERDSRYVGYYLDRQAEDIIKLESQPEWFGVDWRILWEARTELLDRNFIHDGVDKRKFTLPYELKIKN